MSEDYKTITVRVPLDLHARILKVADRRRRSRFARPPSSATIVLEALDELCARELGESPTAPAVTEEEEAPH